MVVSEMEGATGRAGTGRDGGIGYSQSAKQPQDLVNQHLGERKGDIGTRKPDRRHLERSRNAQTR